jgi:hypothetical protein
MMCNAFATGPQAHDLRIVVPSPLEGEGQGGGDRREVVGRTKPMDAEGFPLP